MLDLIQIGKRIADLRTQHGFTQQDLASKLFVTHQAVSKWEQGKSIPSIDILHQLTTLFHITIDALIDATDIEDDDFDTLFQNYSRDIVIQQFLNNKYPSKSIDQLLYRCTKKERLRIIQHLIHHQGAFRVPDIWPYLNPSERIYLLGAILSGQLDFDIQAIRHQLSTQEQQMVHAKYEEGTYQYSPYHQHHKSK